MQVKGTEWKFGLIKKKEKKRREEKRKKERKNENEKVCGSTKSQFN